MRIVSSAEIKKIENECFESGLPSRLVMENAGRAIVTQILERYFSLNKVVIFCGSGNNGGDGFVIARTFSELGIETKIVFVGETTKFSKETLENYRLLSKTSFVDFSKALKDSDLIIDALLGTGAKGAAREKILTAIKQINQLSSDYEIPVVAVDIPSGVDPDTGAVGSEAVQASLTVTFHEPKWGNLLTPANEYNGELIVANIGIPKSEVGAKLLEQHSFQAFNLARDIHKGTKGHLLVIGGSKGKSGSIKLTGLAALKASSGLVTLVVPEDQISVVSSDLLELMSDSLPSDGKGGFSESSQQKIQELYKNKNAIVIGPGMGTTEGASLLLAQLLQFATVPVVLDADALTLLAELDIKLSENFVLTPHPGEMARLLGMDTRFVQANRTKAVKDLSAKFSCWSILKGAQTIISSPNGELSFCSYSCPALATAGSGDVLAGLTASLLGSGLNFENACGLAVYAHACSGLILEGRQAGSFGATATDIIDTLPLVLNSLPSQETTSLFQSLGEQAFLDSFLLDYE